MKTTYLSLGAALIAGALSFLSPSASAQEIITSETRIAPATSVTTVTPAPSVTTITPAPSVVEEHRRTTTTTTTSGKESEAAKEYREKVREAKKDYLEELNDD